MAVKVVVAVAVVVVCVDNHQEQVVDGDPWEESLTLAVVEEEEVVIDLVVAGVAMEAEEIIVIDLHPMVVDMVVIWEEVIVVV
jgi:hypothetical protein